MIYVFSNGVAFAQLDKGFANNGIYIGDTGTFKKLYLQPDKRIIALGGGADAMRFLEDGSLDISFANNGYFSNEILPPFVGYSSIDAVVLQPDGKILLGGTIDTGNTNNDFLVMRLNYDGSMDNSFGGGGYVISSFTNPLWKGFGEVLTSISLQADGKIIALGSYKFSLDTLQLLRYHSDGKIDSSFGINGRVFVYRDFLFPIPNDVIVLPDGKIILGATTRIAAINRHCFTAIRLLSNGDLDTSFNHTGVAYAQIGNTLVYCKAMQVQPDGKILLVGHADSLTVVRFDTSGALDIGFGKIGVVKISNANGNTMVLQPNGNILVGGSLDTAFVTYRLLPNGIYDSSFGIGGSITTKILNEKNKINHIALQQDNKILACGESENFQFPNNYSISTIVRYTPNATNISPTEKNIYFNVYPNPATDEIIIDNNTHKTIRQLSLFTTDGKMIFTRILPNTNRLNTGNLSNGMYLLNIQFLDYSTATRKLMIQKK